MHPGHQLLKPPHLCLDPRCNRLLNNNDSKLVSETQINNCLRNNSDYLLRQIKLCNSLRNK